ncbi:head-tail connector protein [Nocardia rhizosphaerae]|uniref:Head-tail connector protein n=1 Tax=Nocardia rhizosphaerae TaxID=1691571 RepID=A0ABV8LA52_9NOCA
MTAPTYPEACTVAQVKAHLRVTDTTDDDLIAGAVAAVNALVWRWFGTDEIAASGWPVDQAQGAVMLAARVYRRRNSPSGVEALGELGPVYVSRNDPDIAALLGLGAYERPTVA